MELDKQNMNPLQTAVYLLIERFIERQKLVLEVMQKYRPWLTGSREPRASRPDLIVIHSGYWGKDNEWKFFLHGVGCNLTHTLTGEFIGWDASSNSYRFDPNWFVLWLKWLLTYDPEDQGISIILSSLNVNGENLQTGIFEILNQLYQLGKLRYYPDTTNKYELVP